MLPQLLPTHPPAPHLHSFFQFIYGQRRATDLLHRSGMHLQVNPLECIGNYSATSNNMKLVHWPFMGGLLHLVQRGGEWAGRGRNQVKT